jgi:hypothetical protein
MTSSEFRDTIQHRISVLRSLEYRAKRAHALGLTITGWVLTRDEAQGLMVWEGCVTGPGTRDIPRARAKVRKIIQSRHPMEQTA